jgi:hypothetical protein
VSECATEWSGIPRRMTPSNAQLRELLFSPGPFVSLYLDSDPRHENAGPMTRWRWETVRDELSAQGADAEQLAPIDAAVPDAHRLGACLAVMVPARGSPVIAHGPAPPVRDVARFDNLPFVGEVLAWRQAERPYVLVRTDRRQVATAAARDTVAEIERFRAAREAEHLATDGPAETVPALQRSEVDVLLVHEDPDDQRRAWFGKDATAVALSAGELISMGTSQPSEGPLVAVALRAALGTGAQVHVIPAHGGPRDGVGALLRWS